MNSVSIMEDIQCILLGLHITLYYQTYIYYWKSEDSELQSKIGQMENWWIQLFGNILAYVTDDN